MNQYINVNRIEFVITNACGGRCKHCSNGEHSSSGESVNADKAVAVVNRLAERFAIKSVMTFGGEPLLFADTVCKIHAAARDSGIPTRQLITNGFFSKDERKIGEVAKSLCESGVNDVLLSVDSFHQEFIPLEPVLSFAEALLRHAVASLRVHPAWLVDERHENVYNMETKRLLRLFANKDIQANEGNTIFPSGNALKYLSEYFAPPEKVDVSLPCGSMPYTERLDNIRFLGIAPNGDVNVCSISIGNIYADDIGDIVDRYDPNLDPASRAVLHGGVPELLRYARSQGLHVDISDCRSSCGACGKVMDLIRNRRY